MKFFKTPSKESSDCKLLLSIACLSPQSNSDGIGIRDAWSELNIRDAELLEIFLPLILLPLFNKFGECDGDFAVLESYMGSCLGSAHMDFL